MAISNDEMNDDLDYSSLLDSLNNNLTDEPPSLEDVAWADSCLNKDVDPTNADWTSIKDALFEILISQHEPPTTSSQPTDNSIQYAKEDDDGNDVDVIRKRQNRKVFRPNYTESHVGESLLYHDDGDNDVDVLRKGRNRKVFRPNYTESHVDEDLIYYDGDDNDVDVLRKGHNRKVFKPNYTESYLNEDLLYLDDDVRKLKTLELLDNAEEEEEDDDDGVDVLSKGQNGNIFRQNYTESHVDEDLIYDDNGVDVLSKGQNGKVFRPNYTDSSVKLVEFDSDMDLGSISYDEIEPLTEDIFKVWDLGVSSEEVDDFTNQLNKAIADLPPDTGVDDSVLSESFGDVDVDELVAGIGGLSLMKNSE